MNDNDSQYEEPCANCGRILSEDVHIFCLKHTDGDEAVFCSDCWFDHRDEMRKEGWECEDSDDEEEEEDE